ncbi:Type IV secretory pathway, VirD4 components [Escherichia coli]|uniref:Type IV secretory pathway, VirD4 components n=1 Tax=Escherichia coli TaxID=562 RepID=A0A376VSG3_ECOLX|nr:type IV secretory system conjugative DNA transfer family protein [Escherichia coli]STJ14696.1 Type IV secretory pathway, VirD4 components [Escherichia coli]
MSAHPCRIIYAVSEEDDAAKISEKLGYITTTSKRQARTGDDQLHRANQKVKPEEHWCFTGNWERWTFKEEFIILKGENPVKAEKALYYLDPYFMDRLMKVSPKLASLTMELIKTEKIFGVKGLNIRQKKKCLSVGELESEVLL